MKFENPNEGRLSEKEAHEEANMMRVKAGASPKTGKKYEDAYSREHDLGGRELTAEDYSEALKAVEEMKRLAAEESASEELLKKIARIAERTKEGIKYLLNEVVSPGVSDVDAERKHASIMERLDDTESRLNKLRLEKLREEAKKFEGKK